MASVTGPNSGPAVRDGADYLPYAIQGRQHSSVDALLIGATKSPPATIEHRFEEMRNQFDGPPAYDDAIQHRLIFLQ